MIVDTDIGTNVDDCLALAFLARSAECDLGGASSATTIVTGEQTRRIALAQAVYLEAGCSYIVYGGESAPLIGEQLQIKAPLAILPPAEFAASTPSAVEALCDRALKYDGQMTLLCLGPLTNLAVALRHCPTLAACFKKIVMMGGCFGEDNCCNQPETNMRLDPLAAAEVFAALAGLPRRDTPIIDIIGYEVTSRCTIGVDELERRGFSPLCLRLARMWLDAHPGKALGWHDALAAVHAVLPGHRYAGDAPFVSFARGNVQVNAETGRTSFSPDPNGFANVAVEVSCDLFAEYYFNSAGAWKK